MRALEDAVETTSKATTVEISATHTRKYNQLKGNNKASSSNLVNKDKWVNNISKRTLSPVEIAALMKGFNFAITQVILLVIQYIFPKTGCINQCMVKFLYTCICR